MIDTKRPLKVFLCHAHADRDPVRGLYTRLTQDGMDALILCQNVTYDKFGNNLVGNIRISL